MGVNSKRNKNIVAYAKKLGAKYSYQGIADHFKVTRNVVAGVLFRAAHPPAERVRSPNSQIPNKIGTGYRRPRGHDLASV